MGWRDTDSRGRESLDLLVAQYEQLAPTGSLFPDINPDDAEQTARVVCSIALAGDFAQWGYANIIYGFLDSFLLYLGVPRLKSLAETSKEILQSAAWLCLRCVPERKTSDTAIIIKKCARAAARIDDDFGAIRAWESERVHGFVASITQEPLATYFIAKALGTQIRIPHGGALSLMKRLSLVDWTSEFLGGRAALREEAIQVFENLTESEFLTILWWGFEGCDEGCALPCPCYETCPSLLDGNV